MTPLHLEALTPEAKALWPRLPELGDGYYLAGGTALAIQLNHRQSLDFDFFTEKHIPRTQLAKVETVCRGCTIVPSINNRGELTLFIDDVKFSFISYPFPVLMPFAEAQGVKLLSAREIAVTKAYTIGRRGEWKDYVDLHACLTQGVTTLPEIISNAQKKYGDRFNDRLLLEQLVYIDDIDDAQGLETKFSLTREDMRSYFEKTIADLHLAS